MPARRSGASVRGMFHSIVAASDGLMRGRDAVALAARVAQAAGARLTVVGAYQDPLLPLPPQIAAHAEQHRQTEHAITAIRDELAPGAHVVTTPDYSPSRAVRRAARLERADLIVVGSSHRRRLRRMLEGDHALQIADGAPCAVAVVPDGTPDAGALDRIAVGLDGTPESRAALELAHELAARAGAELFVLVVADNEAPLWALPATGTGRSVDWSALFDERLGGARGLLERTLAEIDDVPAAGDVVLGDPARELLDASDSADLLVLGSRSWGPSARVVLGRATEQVVRRAPGAILIVPRPVGAPEDDALSGPAPAKATT